MKKIVSLVLASILGGVLALGGYVLISPKTDTSVGFKQESAKPRVYNTNYIPTSINESGEIEAIDFTKAAEETVNAVVHVKNMAVRSSNPLEEFFYGRKSNSNVPSLRGTGSGVIVDPSGYIITNNHVIQGASGIEISLNNGKNLKAEVIGKDAKNDIALLKVNHNEALPFVTFGNSDNIKVGEWVLAVGNPLNLTSTVTAGIVSAKGRDLEGNGNIDSFIQTDAAVNSGNSGGALVNTRGELIGINTAITSRTGSFEGYSFAVPSNIAKKVIDDLLEFGSVQEALVGFTADLDKSGEVEGVYVGEISEEGSAEKAGIKVSDIITKVDNFKITKFSDLKGHLSAKRPGDKVNITVLRDGREITRAVTLMKKDFFIINSLGISVKDMTRKDQKVFGVKEGAKIMNASDKTVEYFGIKKGFLITKINNENVKSASHAKELIDNNLNSKTYTYIEVVNPSGEKIRIRV